jgi:hypothetical protein
MARKRRSRISTRSLGGSDQEHIEYFKQDAREAEKLQVQLRRFLKVDRDKSPVSCIQLAHGAAHMVATVAYARSHYDMSAAHKHGPVLEKIERAKGAIWSDFIAKCIR